MQISKVLTSVKSLSKLSIKGKLSTKLPLPLGHQIPRLVALLLGELILRVMKMTYQRAALLIPQARDHGMFRLARRELLEQLIFPEQISEALTPGTLI